MLAAKVRIEGSDLLWVAGLQWEPDADVVDTSRFGARLRSSINGVVGLTEATLSDVKGVPSLAAMVSLQATEGVNLFFERVTVEQEDGSTTDGYWTVITQDKSPVYGSDVIHSTEEDALIDLQTKLQALGNRITLVVGRNAADIAEHHSLTSVSLAEFLTESNAFDEMKGASTWSKASTVSVRAMIGLGVVLTLLSLAMAGYYLYDKKQAQEELKKQVMNARMSFMREKNRIIGAPDFNGAYDVIVGLFDRYDWYVANWQVREYQCGMGSCNLRYRTLGGTLSDFALASGTPVDGLIFDSQESGTVTMVVPYEPVVEELDLQSNAGSFNQMVDFCQKARKGGVTCELQPPTPLSFNGMEHISAGQLFSFGQLKIEGAIGDLGFLHRELFEGSNYKWIRISQFDVTVAGNTLNVLLEGSYVVR